MTTLLPSGFYSGNRVRPNSHEEVQSNVHFHQKLRKIEQNSKLFKERPLTRGKKESLFAPHCIWETFATQSQALDYEKYCKEKIERRIFVVSEELSNDGKRHFIVASFDEFWRRYRKLPKKKRNFYEVIPEGQLCRLYFDLEFYKSENPDLQGSDVLDTFIHLVCFYLREKFGISCNRGDIIDLDSSTSDKFSRHLIFHMSESLFCNNIECGNFVKYIYEMARRKFMRNEGQNPDSLRPIEIDFEEEIEPPDGINIRELFINNKDGNITFFADLGVYTKNRNFRLYGSSKFSKDAYLVLSDENGFHGSCKQKKEIEDEQFDFEYLIFLDSLVCYYGKVTNDLKILTFASANTGKCFAYQKQEMQCKIEEGYTVSPYPKLDKFMQTQINKGGVQGKVRRWMYFVNSNMMLYDIDRNHFCENIGRAHKSNHIYFIVNLRHGTFYQKCYDPECFDFKSEEKELPEDVNPILNSSDFLIDDFDDSSSRSLCDAVEIAECGESFADDELNDSLITSGDGPCHKNEESLIKFCNDVNENGDFGSDSLLWESLSDDWAFDVIEESGERCNENNCSVYSCENIMHYVEDNFYVDNREHNGILKTDLYNSETKCGMISNDKMHKEALSGKHFITSRKSDVTKETNDTEFLVKCNVSISHGRGSRQRETYCATGKMGSFDLEERKIVQKKSKAKNQVIQSDIASDSVYGKCHGLIIKHATVAQSNPERSLSLTSISQPDLMNSSPLRTNYLAPSELPDCGRRLSHKNKESGNDNFGSNVEFFDCLTMDKEFASNSLKYDHPQNFNNTSSYRGGDLDTSSLRCELSDFFLDSELDDELLKLD